ncbi:MAG: cysteine desulfurase [Anaerolineae bacterium]
MTPITHQTTPYDLDRVRADFPILAQEHHPGVPLVYLDNAATTQKPNAVIDAITDYYRSYNANVHRGVHLLSEKATEAYEGARLKVRKFINAGSRREIIFTGGTTVSMNVIANAWGRANLKRGDVVILTEMEHHANLVPWQMIAADTGAIIRYVPVLPDGSLDMDAYREILRAGNVKIVGVAHVSNVLGTVNPIAEMARLAHEHGALIAVDGAQSVPHMPVDVRALDCDFFAFSGHKMVAPTGIGVLYGKREVLDAMPPFIGGGSMISKVTLQGSEWNDLPYKFEAGTPPIAEAIGLGAAIDYLSALGMENIHTHTQNLTQIALNKLASVPQVHVQGCAANRAAVIAFTYDGIHPHDLSQALDTEGIAVRAGMHCTHPLHACLNVPATTRASFYLYNTEDEIDRLIDALLKVRTVFHL